MVSTEGVWATSWTVAFFWLIQRSNKHTFSLKNHHNNSRFFFPLQIPEWSKLCALLLFFLLSSFVPSVVPGFCLPSGMVAPHLTACMRNDKMGEASVPQNQTTVCNCPPPLSGSPFHFPSSPVSVVLLYHPDLCVAWPRVIRSIHSNPFTQNALPVPPLP